MFMLTRSKSARLGRIEVLAAELRAARLAEEKAHAAYHAEREAVRRFIADRRKPDGRDVDAVLQQQRDAELLRVAQAQSAEYQAFAQSLREMAVLEATMQSVAESGQRVLQRIQAGRQGAAAG